ncbi:putative DNA-binding protein RAP1 [[Candida] railenensis]|uniref:DNA-binding protein RAP1 n=1 Tax=[Candida] railenensis TaxID=45579 RepID=A0A9P0QU29_9ASCO|nr:putative DNA-binding protein RAP1 [[Candida] railenensis]
MSYGPLYNTQTDYGVPSKVSIFNGSSFYIPNDEPEREKYANLIRANGGLVTDHENPGRSYFLSSTFRNSRDTFNFFFIDNSLKDKIQHDIRTYKNILPAGLNLGRAGQEYAEQQHQQHQQQQHQYPYNQFHSQQSDVHPQLQQLHHSAIVQRLTPSAEEFHHLQELSGGVEVGGYGTDDKRNANSKHSFTPEEDAKILEAVRRDPRRRTSHKLFDEIAKELTNHTGNSIRYRYRNQLESKLEFVYKTNSMGGLIYDDHGNPIHDSIDNLPKTMKNRFTMEEDKLLCEKIVEYNQKLHAKKIEDGLTKEPLDLYSQLTAPVSFFRDMERICPTHTRAAWRDRYRKFATKYGIQRYIDDCEKDNKPGPMKDFTKRGGRILKNSNSDDKSDSKLGIKRKLEIDEEETANGKEIVALDEEIGGIKSSNVGVYNENSNFQQQNAENDEIEDEEDNDEFVDAEENSLGRTTNIAAATVASKSGVNIEESADSRRSFAEMMSQEDESQELAFSYPSPGITIDDIVIKSVFFEKEKDQLLEEINEIIRQGNLEILDLFAEFQKRLGFTDYFCTTIILYSSGVYEKIWAYIYAVIDKIYNYGQLKKNQIYLILEIEGIDGVWNKSYDDLLLSEIEADFETLKQVQSEVSIIRRKQFLDSSRKPEPE